MAQTNGGNILFMSDAEGPFLFDSWFLTLFSFDLYCDVMDVKLKSGLVTFKFGAVYIQPCTNIFFRFN